MNMRPSDAHIQYGLLLNPWDQWGEFGVRPKIYEESQHIKVAMLCGEIQRTLALRAPTIKTMIVGIYVIHVSLRVIFKHLFHFCNTFRATAKFINSSRSIHTLIYIWRIFLNASFLQSHSSSESDLGSFRLCNRWSNEMRNSLFQSKSRSIVTLLNDKKILLDHRQSLCCGVKDG